VEDVNLDFQVIGPSDVGSHLVDVLLAASHRKNVDDRVAALELGVLTAALVDIEVYAMESACRLLPLARDGDRTEETLAIADIGATTMTLYVLHGRRSVYTREQRFGGDRLITEVQQRYDMDRDEALRQLLGGSLPDCFTTEVLRPFQKTLAQQIGRALQFFYSTGTRNRVDRVVLAGGPAGIPDIDAQIDP